MPFAIPGGASKKSIRSGGQAMKVFLIWNEDKSEGVVFTDRRDAEDAAGISRPSIHASTLAESFRSIYADEDIFDEPVHVFEIQEIDI
ncbi:hypothetical protein [Pseudomonas aeruginosa]|uniref:hypothetical protein n=2 Tax=Pseudomonas aeruginosa TaxID=287 RepID=UPI000F5421A8|nr:hypothetical protein [Pseudomonas aeruginosa]WCW05331.1 hypothetical protein KK222_15800 [Pseudomonas aeruginosa]